MIPRLFFTAALCLTLSGCVVPFPFRLPRTPAVSGRVVDAATHAPVAGARLSFLNEDGGPRLSRPTGRTDAAGCFRLACSYNYYPFAIFLAGPCTFWMWPNLPSSNHLYIEDGPDHFATDFDIHAAFKKSGIPAQHAKDRHYGIEDYRETFPLGDIPLKKAPIPYCRMPSYR